MRTWRLSSDARNGHSHRACALALAALLILPSCAVFDPGPAAPPKDRYIVFFESKSTSLDEEAAEVVAQIAADAGRAQPEQIVIRGYADPRGSAGENARLSDERAQTVARALMERGIEAKRLRTEAFGETSTGGDPVLQSADRRVEVLFRPAP